MEGRTDSVVTPSAPLSLELEFQQAMQLDATHPPIHSAPLAAEDAGEHYVTAASNFPMDLTEGRLGTAASSTHAPMADPLWSSARLPHAYLPSRPAAGAGADLPPALHIDRKHDQQQQWTGVAPLWHQGVTRERPGDLDRHMGSFGMGLPTPAGPSKHGQAWEEDTGVPEEHEEGNQPLGSNAAFSNRQVAETSHHAASPAAMAAPEAVDSSCSLVAWVAGGAGGGSVPLAAAAQQVPGARALSLPGQPSTSPPAGGPAPSSSSVPVSKGVVEQMSWGSGDVLVEPDDVGEDPDQVHLSEFEKQQLSYAHSKRLQLRRHQKCHQEGPRPLPGTGSPSLAQQQQQQGQGHAGSHLGPGYPTSRAATAPPRTPAAAAAATAAVTGARQIPSWPPSSHGQGPPQVLSALPGWLGSHALLQPQGSTDCSGPNSSRQPSVGSAGSGSARAGEEQVRVLLSSGGAFERQGAARTWMYVGGDTRLVRLGRSNCLSQLLAAVLAAAPGAGSVEVQSMQPTLKYALPGGDAPLFVALGADADVANMWEEWEEGAAATPGAPGKLQLFLEVMSQPDNQQQQKQVQQEERVDREQPQQQQPAAGQGGAVAGLASSTTLAATAMATATTAPVAPATPTTSTGASRSGRGGGGGQGARGQLPAAGDSASPGGPPAARQACSQLSPFATSPFQQVAAVTFDQGSPGTAGVGLDRQHGEQGSEQHQEYQRDEQQQQQQQQGRPGWEGAASCAALPTHLPSRLRMASTQVAGSASSSINSTGTPGVAMSAAAVTLGKGLAEVTGEAAAAAGVVPEAGGSTHTAAGRHQVVAACCSSSTSSSTWSSGHGAAVHHDIEVAGVRVTGPTQEEAAAPGPTTQAAPARAAAAAAAPCNTPAVPIATGEASCSVAGPRGEAVHVVCGPKGSPAGGGSPAAALGQVRHQLRAAVQQLSERVEVIQPWELQVVRFLGAGAFGEVFLSRWHGTEVAVKCLSPGLLAAARSTTVGHAPTRTPTLHPHSGGSSAAGLGTPDSSSCSSSRGEAGGMEAEDSNDPGTAAAAAAGVAGLLQEASILAGLRHPNVVAVYGVVLPPSDILGNSSGFNLVEQEPSLAPAPSAAQRHAAASPLRPPALVTEYLAGGSLRAALSRGAEWLLGAPLAKVKVLLDTARGLDYLHAKRLVHFDLKSANLLLGWRDRVPVAKVADFGLSKQKHSTYVSGINTLRGTLPWMAPEVLTSPDTLTEAADIYSFGVIMWEVWKGAEPWEGLPIHALIHRMTSPPGPHPACAW